MFVVEPKKLVRWLLIAVAVIVVLNLAEGFHRYVYGEVETPLAVALGIFDVDAENSVPTWYAVMLLATAAAILAVISRLKLAARDRYRRYWVGLAIIFLFLSMDEGAVIHERTRPFLLHWGDVSPLFYFGWVVLYGALVLIFAAFYFPFWLRLPPRTRGLVALSGVVFVGGALGMELAMGVVLTTYGPGIETGLLVILEETMELAGVIIFIYALLDYLRSLTPSVAFQLAPASGRSGSGPAVEPRATAERPVGEAPLEVQESSRSAEPAVRAGRSPGSEDA